MAHFPMKRVSALFAGALLVLAFVAPADAARPARGYQPRNCGFDLDHNGVVGQPSDCSVCSSSDGTLTVGGSSYAQVYVDCGTGNNANAGTRAAPLRTVGAALNRTPPSGATLAVCIRGTCSAESWPLSPRAGIAGSYARSTTPSENGTFSFPTRPTILSGWDSNGDGAYPPNSGETAVLDGNSTATITMNAPSYFEMAHLTVQRFANTSAAQNQFTYLVEPDDAVNYTYFHDTIWQQIHQATASGLGGGEQVVFSLYNGTGWRNAAWINNVVRDFGNYIWRGSTTNQAGPIRIQNTTVRGRPTLSNGTPYTFKSWGLYSNIEFLDNDADAQPSLWMSSPREGLYSVAFTPCTQDVTLRNNKFSNYEIAIGLSPDAGTGYCVSRPVSNITIDANEIRNSWSYNCYGAMAIRGDGSQSGPNAYLGNLTITNNLISSTNPTTGGFQAGILLNPRVSGSCSDLGGAITIVGNTFDFAPRRFCGNDQTPYGFIAITAFDGTNSSCRQQTFDIRNNIFSNRRTQDAGGAFITTDYVPTQWTANYNVFNDSAVPGFWAWNNGSQTSLAAWRTSSGNDANARDCAPSFVSAATGDYHLQSTDTCARDQGTNVVAGRDYDGDTRPQGGGWDIGADEFGSGSGGGGPTPPVLLDVTPVP